MCGIAILLGKRRSEATVLIQRMADRMVHRGPDDLGTELIALREGPDPVVIAFGFRRLSIQDLSPLGHQPMVHPVTGDVLVFNGEIYNFRELREELIAQGSVFRGKSDTEVLLHGLARHGDGFVERLSGMFAFSFFERSTRRLLLVRDHLGIKPLCVASGEWGMAGASELKALTECGHVDTTPNPQAVAGLLAYGAVPEPLTILMGARRFPAGCLQWITFDAAGMPRQGEIKRYWKWPEVDPSWDEARAVAAVRESVEAAVKSHLIADVPVGVFLSSGVDSTIMAAMAAKHDRHTKTFTVGFADHPDLSESAEAARTAQALGVEFHDIQLPSGLAVEHTKEWLRRLDYPSVDGLNTWVISHALRATGTVVGVSGLGGDELFGGYPSFFDVPRALSVHRKLRAVPKAARSGLFWLSKSHASAAVREKAWAMGGAGDDIVAQYMLRRRMFSDKNMKHFGIDPIALGLDETYQHPAVISELRDTLDSDPIAAISRMESRFYMGNMLLRDSDAYGMAHSLEIRVPFLDRRVVETAASIPGNIRLPRGGGAKHLLKKAFAPELRSEIAGAKKRGFTLPIRRWMLGPLAVECESSLDALKDSGLFRADQVTALWESFRAHPESPIWSSAFMLVVLGAYLVSNGLTSGRSR